MPARRSADFSRSWPKNLLGFILLLAAFALPAWEQEQAPTTPPPQVGASPSQPSPAQEPPGPSAPPTPSQPAAPSQQQVPGTGISVQQQQPPSGQPGSGEQGKNAGPITKQQEKELFRSVNQILQFASTDTGLPIRHKVKRKLITRQAVAKYVEDRMKEDKDTQRLERSEAVLIKFGLLPPNYDLHTEYLRLLQEQVAAFYDPKSKSVNLLDWVPPDQQKPVLAHELTHALQDQYIGLDKWELAGGNENDAPLPDNQEEVVEEAQAAREALAEGQAMIVFIDYSLAPLGTNVLKTPEAVDTIRAGMGDSPESPIFSAAPMYLRESMMMPYTFGTEFVRDVLQNRGKDAAFAGMLEKPPVDTRQVMEPDTYLKGETVEPLKVPDLDKLVGPDYERYDFGGMGEFDVYLLAKLYAPEKNAKDFYSNWRGGYYLIVHAKGAPSDEVALLYMSRWDAPEAAQAFATVYEDYVPNRYPRWSKEESTPKTQTTAGAISTWWEGPESARVQVLQDNSDLLILEGFDQSVAQRLTCALLQCSAVYEGNRPSTHAASPN
ncbi:MAG: hypothetical protein WAM71_16845 [Candidatus Korobacteraceae bacterium]